MSAHDKFDRDDWRLSAYVAGELDGEDRATIDRLLAENEDARAFVAELKEAAGDLREALASEAAPALTESQRAAIGGPRGGGFGLPHLAAAAALLVVAGLGVAELATMDRSTFDQERSRMVTQVDRSTRTLDSGALEELEEMGYLRDDAVPARTPSPRESTVAARPTAAADGLRALGYVGGGAYKGPGDAVPPGLAIAEGSTEEYDAVDIAGFRRAVEEAMSTFSIDVDTASYANVRRFLNDGALPPVGAVRVEEFVNYFSYTDATPSGVAPFAVTTEVASAPWAPRHRLIRIGLKGRSIDWSERKPSNLVFLLDVSGSMNSDDKLPLLAKSLRLLARSLDHRDRVAIVVYAGASGLVLPSTPGHREGTITGVLDRLRAGGSTNGGAGIELAYRVAQENFVEGGINRVILATDGDFNVGVSDESSLVKMIEEKRKSGVFLSVFGFGRGNLNDSTMEKLADEGNGNYSYIDSLDEAKKVLVEQVGGTMMAVAKDVKIQVEFNPAAVTAWRLIGYENRQLAHQDFADDTKDAGEIGAGLSVTALYEVVPAGAPYHGPAAGERRYTANAPKASVFAGELMFLKLRYKEPDGDVSKLIQSPVKDTKMPFAGASTDLRWAASVAAFAEVLRESEHLDGFDLSGVKQLAWEARGEDPTGRRAEMLELVDKARKLRSEDV